MITTEWDSGPVKLPSYTPNQNKHIQEIRLTGNSLSKYIKRDL